MKIYQFEGAGYKPLISYNGWRVAVAGFAEHLLEENLRKLERHLQTDEVFILLQGEAVLHIGMEKERCPMEIGKIYNVLCGEWRNRRRHRRIYRGCGQGRSKVPAGPQR